MAGVVSGGGFPAFAYSSPLRYEAAGSIGAKRGGGCVWGSGMYYSMSINL